MYQHVLAVEGVRHPLNFPELLDETAEYIKYAFEQYGLKTSEHVFEVEGFDYEFKNVEGILGDGSKPELLVTSHYDTVNISPGANDNGSGIAGMLEIARVLAENELDYNIRFISFTLEEAHPTKETEILEQMMKSGLVDEEFRFLSYQTIKKLDKVDDLREEAVIEGKTIHESWIYAKKKMKDELTKAENNYLDSLIKHYSGITRTNWIGESICVGSTQWVKDNLKNSDDIIGVINLEEIGYKSEKKFTQEYPPGMNPNNYPSFKVNVKERVGDFVGIFGDTNSLKLAQTFCKQCEEPAIDLPYHNLSVNLGFEDIALKIIDLLRSDHAPFWRANIPAITITDTFEFRYPYYHTSADVSDFIDFDFMKQICQATLATILEINSSQDKNSQ